MDRQKVLRELRYAVRQLQHLADQLAWRLRLRGAATSKRPGSAAVRKSLQREGRRLLADLGWLRRDFLIHWASRNRPQGKRVHLGLLRGTESFYRSLLGSI